MSKLTKNSIEELEARLFNLTHDLDDEDRASWASTIKEIEALLADPTHERLSRSPEAYEELEMMGDSSPVVRRDLNKADKLQDERYIAEHGPYTEIVVRIRRR